MKTIYQLAESIIEGSRPEVQFTKKIEDCESYPEGNMRATIIGAEFDHDGVVKLQFDYSKFDEMNKAHE